MIRTLTLAATALAIGTAALVPATPALAQRYDRGYSYDRYGNSNSGYRDGYRSYDARSYRNRYRYTDRCKDGDGGTVIGAIAGGLAGHEIAGRRGDRTLGAILGGALGAVAGRAIDKADRPRGC